MTSVYNRIGDICDNLCETLRAKNSNYGNTADQPPYFTPWLDGETALWVRLSDKIARLKSLRSKEEDKVGESIKDTLLDMCGYGILLLLKIEEKETEIEGAEE